MPRLNTDQWHEARAFYEAGASQVATAERFKVSRKAIQKRIDNEGWIQDLEPTIRRRAAEKVAQVAGVASEVALRDPQKTDAAIDAEAERRAEVERRHRREADVIRERLNAALLEARAATTLDDRRRAFELFKQARIIADTLTLTHAIERKAWRLDDPSRAPGQIAIEVTW